MYGKIGTVSSGASGATLAFTGTTLNSMALIVAGTTLIAAAVAIRNLAPRISSRRR